MQNVKENNETRRNIPDEVNELSVLRIHPDRHPQIDHSYAFEIQFEQIGGDRRSEEKNEIFISPVRGDTWELTLLRILRELESRHKAPGPV